jgi:hypothetical protein
MPVSKKEISECPIDAMLTVIADDAARARDILGR